MRRTRRRNRRGIDCRLVPRTKRDQPISFGKRRGANSSPCKMPRPSDQNHLVPLIGINVAKETTRSQALPGNALVAEAPASRVHKLMMHFGEAEPRLH